MVRPDVALLEREVGVARTPGTRVVGLSAHDARWPPPNSGRLAGEAGTASS